RNNDGTPRNKQARATVQQLPLIEQLALFIQDNETRSLLLHRSERQASEKGVYCDIYDGKNYKKLKKDGLFSGNLDIAISIYTDGFTALDKQLTIIHIINFNLPQSIRYENENMLQLCIIPSAPKDLESFLQPMINSLEILQTSGIWVKADDGDMYHVRCHALLVTGDIPACAKMIGHKGHQSRYGCRLCKIKGSGIRFNGRKRGMYFVSRRYPKPKKRTKKELISGVKKKGILVKSVFTQLSSFKNAHFYGLDIMHLIGLGIGKQVWNLISKKIYGDVKRNPFYLKPATQKKIGTAMKNSKHDLPTSFTTCTRDISSKTKLKAIEWIDMMRYVVPTIITEHIKDKDAKKALLSLSLVSNIIFKKTITERDLWCAAFAMERALGEVKRKVKSRSKQGVEAGNVMVKLAAKRYCDRVTPSPVKSTSNKNNTLLASDELNDPEIWDPIWNTTINDLNTKYKFSQLLKSFWSIYIDDLEPLNQLIEAGARLWISDHEIIGSSFRPRDESRHIDYFVKMVIDVNCNQKSKTPQRQPKVYFGEVVLYFRHSQQTNTKLLALVKVWKTNLDNNGYPYLAPKVSYRHVVIDVGDIQSIAGIYTTTAGVRYIVYHEMDLLTKKELGPISSLDDHNKKTNTINDLTLAILRVESTLSKELKDIRKEVNFVKQGLKDQIEINSRLLSLLENQEYDEGP
ncbi:hypothetical protein INT45_000417, partial [Circinella minor]